MNGSEENAFNKEQINVDSLLPHSEPRPDREKISPLLRQIERLHTHLAEQQGRFNQFEQAITEKHKRLAKETFDEITKIKAFIGLE